MEVEFFTENGCNSVREYYKHLIGKEFYFNSKEQPKDKLIDIVKSPSGNVDGGYYINFLSAKLTSLPIYNFMQLNDIEYNCKIFERIGFRWKQV